MKLKSIFKCLTITAVLSQIAVYPTNSYAVSDNENKIKMENKKSIQGLVGYYFKDTQFQELDFISLGGQSKLLDKEKLNNKNQTIRWIGRIKPSHTGNYIISTSSDKNIVLQVNGETIINQESTGKPLKLEKDKLYELKIEYQNITDSSSDLQLFWSIDGKQKEQIPQKNVLSPNFSEKENLPNDKKDMLLLPNFNLFDNTSHSSNLKDTDKDGIPDEWEEQGYTFKNQQIVKWEDSYLAQGYKNYVSNPYKARTVADPYTDFEKVSGHMPEATKDEAKDPLVAAYPAVGVGMENLIFSKNENVTEGASGTKSKSVTDTNTNTNSVDVGGEVGGSINPFAFASFKVSTKYSHSWTNSTAIQNSESESWSKQIGINTAESAFLNANVRYYNAGTAPIYDLRPTSNFVFQNSGTSIATITAGANQIGNSLGPSDTYPKREQAPISLDKANEEGTVKIAINGEQLNAIQSHSEKLNLETTQNKGQYGILDDTGKLVTDASKQWDPIRTNIDAVSGSLILDAGTSKENLERRVAAKNENDPEDKTPEITIGDAIKKAFNAKEKDGRLYYTDRTGTDIYIDESSVNLIVDEKTHKEIEKQLEQIQDKKVYKTKWKRGMNITLRLPIAYYDFEASGNTNWHYTNQENGGYTGKKHGMIGPNGNGYAKKNLDLQPYTSYTARAYVKTASPIGKNNVMFYADSTISGDGNGARQNVTIEGDKWHVIEFSFNTGGHPEYFQKLGLKNTGNTNLQFDDVSVSKWRQVLGENLIKNGNFDEGKNYWKTTNGDFLFEIKDGYLIGGSNRVVINEKFKVKPNTTYKLEYDLRTNPGFKSNPKIKLIGTGSRMVFEDTVTLSNDWKTYSFDFTTDSNTQDISFQIFDTKQGGYYNLDNVKFREVCF
ncbi:MULTISPECIES: binary toxin-like calcium binding domain-containing protein [Bacillus]|uniref:binary toxin-like calcium binding domain-containing protein n=1 Tax=Bacillus TaxID=1386 RepID=UPI000B5DA124|nr:MULTISPECIES: binary toxin-like calcium binding domain-containing protein [Bacillus]OXB97314.1 Iota toxin protein Ib [Bacillus sp. M13(2017)]QCY64827.1 Iota toxin protein Ib [Bacillus thuringiensis]